jgi:predicted DCC family thiol-disulfide oxidoreductase YuxK
MDSVPAATSSTENSGPNPADSKLIMLFDGACGLCDSVVGFVLARDSARKFQFAPLQSEIGRTLLTRHGLDPADLGSIVLIDHDRAYLRSNAVLRILTELPEPWPLAGAVVFVPQPLRDAAYDFVARHRKQWFKTPDACRTPTPEQREQFLAF